MVSGGDSDSPRERGGSQRVDKSYLLRPYSPYRKSGTKVPPLLPGLVVVIPEPGYPTEYAPGTPEKLVVMAARSRRMEMLFHPYDARWLGDSRPYFFGIIDGEEREQIIFDLTVRAEAIVPVSSLIQGIAGTLRDGD